MPAHLGGMCRPYFAGSGNLGNLAVAKLPNLETGSFRMDSRGRVLRGDARLAVKSLSYADYTKRASLSHLQVILLVLGNRFELLWSEWVSRYWNARYRFRDP